VSESTHNKQLPEYLDKRLYDFHFVPVVPIAPPAPSACTPPLAPVQLEQLPRLCSIAGSASELAVHDGERVGVAHHGQQVFERHEAGETAQGIGYSNEGRGP
jgi:hypothetical protein